MTRDEMAAVVRDVLREERRQSATDPAVLKTVTGILTAFGINDDERFEIRKDFAYVRRWRQTAEHLQRGYWLAIVGLFVSGMASMAYVGIKTILGKW